MINFNEIKKLIDNDHPNIQEIFLECSKIFEEYMLTEGYKTSKDISKDDEVNINALVNSIKQYIERNRDMNNVGTAVWVLGKLNDKNLYSYYIKLLNRFKRSNNTALYQTMIAISNIDSSAFRNESFSLFDTEKNKHLVDSFLNNL